MPALASSFTKQYRRAITQSASGIPVCLQEIVAAKSLQLKGVVGIWPASAVGDDIEVCDFGVLTNKDWSVANAEAYSNRIMQHFGVCLR